MLFKFVFILLSVITFVASNDTIIEDKLFVVSTTSGPSTETRLTKIENQISDLKTFINSSLERRLTEIENQLKDYSTRRQTENQILTILTEMQRSLKNVETNSLEKLENVETSTNSSLEERVAKIKNQNTDLAIHKIDRNSAAIAKIQKSLKNIEQNLETLNLQNNKTRAFPRHCKDILSKINTSGIYLIKPEASPEAFQVFCDMETHGGGWTYFLNRMNGLQDFYQNWENYKNGFGKLYGEFWLGLQNLYHLTGRGKHELLVELEDWEGREVYAHYSSFGIGSQEDGYSLKILEGYNGTAGDALSDDIGRKFSTKTRDQDDHPELICAEHLHGAFWYRNCGFTSLCGKYMEGTVDSSNGEKIMYWYHFRGMYYSLKKARMMTRPII